MRCDIISSRVAIVKKKKKSSVSKDIVKLEPSCTVGGNVKFSCSREQYVVFQYIKKELPYDPIIILLGMNHFSEFKIGIQTVVQKFL